MAKKTTEGNVIRISLTKKEKEKFKYYSSKEGLDIFNKGHFNNIPDLSNSLKLAIALLVITKKEMDNIPESLIKDCLKIIKKSEITVEI